MGYLPMPKAIAGPLPKVDAVAWSKELWHSKGSRLLS